MIAIRNKDRIEGVRVQKVEAKIAMYADDIVCFLEYPLISIKELCKVIGQFCQISGYKVNWSKSIFCGFNIST